MGMVLRRKEGAYPPGLKFPGPRFAFVCVVCLRAGVRREVC